MDIRPYQAKAIGAIIENYVAGVRRQLIVMATGTGKTVVFSKAYAALLTNLAEQMKGKMLVMAHTEELIDQNMRTLQDTNPNVKVGKEMNIHRADVDCDIVVACIASIGREASTRLERFGKFSVIICDEAHHSIAQSYVNVFTKLGIFEPENKTLLVGFTATPKRKNRIKEGSDDLISLASVYEKIVFSYPMRKAIKDGWLVPIRGFKVQTTANLDNVKTVAGDYKQDELSYTVNTPERNVQAVKAWKDYGENRQTVGFTVDIAHAQALAKCFRDYEVPAEAVWGLDPDRATKLESHKSGAIRILLNCQVLTEGYDDWRVGCILEASPTRSGTKYTQCIGRGTRLQAGTGNLLEALAKGLQLEKRDCIVIDMVDNASRCSLVTLPTLVGLDPEFDFKGQSITEVAEKMEALQEKHPGINFVGLKSLDEVTQYVESIDMFASPYSEEVKEFSDLCWMESQDGSYVLSIPEAKGLVEAAERNPLQRQQFLHEKLHLTQNDLDQWVLSIESRTNNSNLGDYKDLREAFEVADDVIRRCRTDRLKLLRREAFWHDNLASDAAKNLLKRLLSYSTRKMLWCLCPSAKLKTAGVVQRKGSLCPLCKLQLGLTAGQCSTAINVLQSQ